MVPGAVIEIEPRDLAQALPELVLELKRTQAESLGYKAESCTHQIASLDHQIELAAANRENARLTQGIDVLRNRVALLESATGPWRVDKLRTLTRDARGRAIGMLEEVRR
jgi:hypothetical protein